MRVWALALTRNRAAADDLTQDVATKALLAQDCFIPGTNFSAWVHRIMINHFISSVRNRREFTDMDTVPEQPVLAAHEDRTALRELSWALKRLPRDQREALFMIALQEIPYETAAARTGCAIGTLKSRVHRARLQLRSFMLGEGSGMHQAAARAG
jgi:RNA polymerase sigma-70 factor (ECF subfamily)